MVSGSTTVEQFALLPGKYDLSTWSGVSSATATDAQECLDTAWYADSNLLAFSFDNTTGDCKYATTLNGYAPYRNGGPPDYYLRSDGIVRVNDTCLTEQDGEYLVMLRSYGNATCPRLDITQGTEFCEDSLSSAPDYGVYKAGYFTNGTTLILTKDLVRAGIDYQCNAMWKMIFNGIWYCYVTYGIGAGDGKYSLIADNFCDSQTSGSTSVVVADAREYFWLYKFWPWDPSFIGLILDNVTSTFKWYDGSTSSVPWAFGYPNNDTGNKTLAIVNSDGLVQDEDPLSMTALVCRWSASYQPYDPSTTFY